MLLLIDYGWSGADARGWPGADARGWPGADARGWPGANARGWSGVDAREARGVEVEVAEVRGEVHAEAVGHLFHLDDGLDVDRHAVLLDAVDRQRFLLTVGVDAFRTFRFRGVAQLLQEGGEVLLQGLRVAEDGGVEGDEPVAGAALAVLMCVVRESRSPALQVDSLPAKPPGKPKNTGVGSLALLQGIFPTQEMNWGLLHCRQILYQLELPGKPSEAVIHFQYLLAISSPNFHWFQL